MRPIGFARDTPETRLDALETTVAILVDFMRQHVHDGDGNCVIKVKFEEALKDARSVRYHQYGDYNPDAPGDS